MRATWRDRRQLPRAHRFSLCPTGNSGQTPPPSPPRLFCRRNLDRKLEDRREELRVRTERARLLQTAASGGGAEASLDGSHHGPTGFSGGTADGLSPEEERVILDELKLVNARVSDDSAEKASV